jgi:hypothetical protein
MMAQFALVYERPCCQRMIDLGGVTLTNKAPAMAHIDGWSAPQPTPLAADLVEVGSVGGRGRT